MSDAPDSDRGQYVSRGGIKLAAALDRFGIDPAGWVCADFGSHVGGFVDVLLRRGAARVFAVDTGYGTLDYSLRRDARVVVLERRNALHTEPPAACRLVTIDVGWTRQALILPAAARWLDAEGTIVSLVKPHYEAPAAWLRDGVLPSEHLQEVVGNVLAGVASAGLELLDRFPSPIPGHGGNAEVFIHVARAASGSG